LKDEASRLKKRLKKAGLSDAAINAAWPQWWSEEAETSASARIELRFSIARKFGLDPRSLLEGEGRPRFVWRDEARFKHLSGEGQLERSAIASFGSALGSYLISATAVPASPAGADAASLRSAILREQKYVRLADLLTMCWSIGIPVVHLRIFPGDRKRMSAMTVRVGERNAIMMGKDSMYPPHLAFYLAHELAHVFLGHLDKAPMIVDLETATLASPDDDPEEAAADRFALELLTGLAEPKVLPKSSAYNATQLARAVLDASVGLRIEPGTLALCFGYSTGHWMKVNAAMKQIYRSPRPVWSAINAVALSQLNFGLIPEDARPYVRAALGEDAAT
jgi:hypothetical protein